MGIPISSLKTCVRRLTEIPTSWASMATSTVPSSTSDGNRIKAASTAGWRHDDMDLGTSMHHELESVVRVRTGRTDRSAVEQPPRSERQMPGPACHRAGHPATVVGLDEVVAVNTVVGVLVVGRGCVVGGKVDVSVGCG